MKSIVGTAELKGASFHYEMAGIGPPVVLIHAGIADSRMWEGQFAPLSKWFKVIRYDMRGYGRTKPVDGQYSHRDDLAALLRHLDIDKASLVGCSLGSKTALHYALRYPGRVERLVLTSPALDDMPYRGPIPPQSVEIDMAEIDGDRARVNELEIQYWIDGARGPEDIDPQVRAMALEMNGLALSMEGIGREVRPPPVADRLAEIHAPSLIIIGEVDNHRTLATAKWLGKHLPDSRQAVMSGLTHLPNMERPEEYNQLVSDFLRG